MTLIPAENIHTFLVFLPSWRTVTVQRQHMEYFGLVFFYLSCLRSVERDSTAAKLDIDGCFSGGLTGPYSCGQKQPYSNDISSSLD